MHLRRLDLTVAIDGRLALAVKQRRWPQARQALTAPPRQRLYRGEMLQPPLRELMYRLRFAPCPPQGASNDLF